MYGTAWKNERTQSLTHMAIRSGCRAIDTANQRKHYYEVGVGAALQQSYTENLVTRDQLFLQTKFTYQRGQDHRLPYNPNDTLDLQVHQSFASSLDNLGTNYMDSYILHGPYSADGISQQDRLVWATMESIQKSGKIHHLGLSNVSLHQLEILFECATIKPSFVQNRCFATTRWDYDVREFCFHRGIVYQGFSLLTANIDYLRHPTMIKLAQQHLCTIAQLVFRFSQQVGMLPLTGTSNAEHLESDLSCESLNLSEDELESIETIAWL
jgi:diketogulonate reductase-like aldo/keto reductase